MTDQVIVTDDGPIRTVRMNRPDKKNALTAAMYDAMAEALETAGGSSPIRCVLIAGVPGAFSAGNDLQDFMKAAMGGEGPRRPRAAFHFAGARRGPLDAAVQGVAVGIGTTRCSTATTQSRL
jgi:enoyl-CoA hydratase/carnithine racemase